jgi:uncharacterized protein (TIGR02996 family)
MTDPKAAERQPFLAAIRANPEDDLTRLVYADWLEENGEPDRAYLIRWQISNGVPFTRDAQFGRWRNPSKVGVDVGDLSAVFRGLNAFLSESWPGLFVVTRGFVSEVRCDLAGWLRDGPAVVREHPVERVVVTDVAPSPVNTPPAGAWAWSLGVVDRMPDSARGYFYPRWHQTETEATDYMSKVLVAWAESLNANTDAFADLDAEIVRWAKAQVLPLVLPLAAAPAQW